MTFNPSSRQTDRQTARENTSEQTAKMVKITEGTFKIDDLDLYTRTWLVGVSLHTARAKNNNATTQTYLIIDNHHPTSPTMVPSRPS